MHERDGVRGRLSVTDAAGANGEGVGLRNE